MSPKYMASGSPEAIEAAAQKMAHERGIERAEWANLWRIYERCVEISELVWTERLDAAQGVQQRLAEEMRDRGYESPAIAAARRRFMDALRGGATPVSEAQASYVAALSDPNNFPHGGTLDAGEIPVPLFTPRDRAQFVKEVAATLLISADRRNLSVRFPKEKPTDAPTQPEANEGIEAASGTSETDMEQEAEQVAAQGDVGERSGQAGDRAGSPEVVITPS